MSLIIDINNENNSFYLQSFEESLLKNKRLLVSFKRLGYELENENIIIPFREETQIKTLQEIERLLKKFDINYSVSKRIKAELNSYHKEEENFELFSENARSIRNNEFEKKPDLYNQFKEFDDVLKSDLIR